MSWDQFHSIEPVDALIGRLYLEGRRNFEIIEREKVSTIPDSEDRSLYDWNYPASLEHVTIEFRSGTTKGMPEVIKYIPKIYKEEISDDTGYTHWMYYPENETPTIEQTSLIPDENIMIVSNCSKCGNELCNNETCEICKDTDDPAIWAARHAQALDEKAEQKFKTLELESDEEIIDPFSSN